MGQPLFFERGCSPQVFFLTHMEIGEAPLVADEASRFRGSGTIGAPERAWKSLCHDGDVRKND